MEILKELADKYGGFISDLRFDSKKKNVAIIDLLATQLYGNFIEIEEYQEAILYLSGF